MAYPVVDSDATVTEVDDMESFLCTPAIGWTPIAVRRRVVGAPNVGGYATGVPFAGHRATATAHRATAPVAAPHGARSTDLPGLPARAAPV